MRIPAWFSIILLILAVIVTGVTAVFAYINVRQFSAEAPVALPTLPDLAHLGLGASAVPTSSGPTEIPTVTPKGNLAAATTPAPTSASSLVSTAPTSAPSAAPGASPAVAPLSSPTRITILLMGIDQRKGETGAFRTDTMMVLSIDPARKTAAMLSIPRDIYIQIPGYAPNRINTAYDVGEQVSYPGGGGMLAVKTVQRLIGIPIQHYILINFEVFNAAIDAIGPIRVCPDKAIHDDKYPDGSYGYITVDFQAGCQDLDSTKLLQYARVRHNAGDDFGRAQRQQEVIKAVRDKILSLGGVSALIGQVGQLWGSVKTNVKTDMTFDEMLQLGQFAQGIPKEAIRSEVLTDRGGYLIPSKTTQGEDVFTPVYEKIHDLVDTLFGTSSAASITSAPTQAPVNAVVASSVTAVVQPTQATPLVQPNGSPSPAAQPSIQPSAPSTAQPDNSGEKAATIQVSNGAGVDGLGKQTVDKLRGLGFTVLDAKNADLPGGYARTVIKVYTGKTQVARALAAALGLDGSVIAMGDAKTDKMPDNVDIQVIIGKDLAPPGK